MSRYEELAALVEEMLERFGVNELSPMDPEEMTTEDLTDRLAGIEGYSMDFNAVTYIMMPEDVQELFLLMASNLYADSDEEYELSDEEE